MRWNRELARIHLDAIHPLFGIPFLSALLPENLLVKFHQSISHKVTRIKIILINANNYHSNKNIGKIDDYKFNRNINQNRFYCSPTLEVYLFHWCFIFLHRKNPFKIKALID